MDHAFRRRCWSAVIADFHHSGLTHAEFCRRRHVSIHSFRKRLYQLRSAQASQSSSAPSAPLPAVRTPAISANALFLPVHIRSQPRSSSSQAVPSKPAATLELVLPDDRLIRVPVGFDPPTLRQLLAVLEDQSC